MKRLLVVVIVLFSAWTVKADEGMWLLSRLKQQNIEDMQKMGFKLSAEDVYDLNKPGIKDAIVGLGREGRPFRHFCSGEIISPEGLMLTNHHCGFDAIQKHSTVEHDYLSDGFWAFDKKDELANPGITASILDRIEDVTGRVNAVLNDNMTEAQRNAAIDSVSKIIVKEATEGTELSGQVQPMFEGNQFFLFLYTIYKDVRLVGAPPQSMGKFGGDTDNWMWPRHTADFSMFRIYTGPDGKPAAYSKDNIPLKPKHHLPVSAKGVQDGDFAMIMGFPGSTDRYLTSFGLKNTMEAVNDVRYKVRTVALGIMREEMDKSHKTSIQYASKYASSANYWKYSNEQNKALKQLNTMGQKEAIEQEFTAWVNANAARKAKYGDVLSVMQKAYNELYRYTLTGNYGSEALNGPEAHQFAAGMGGMLKVLCDPKASAGDKEQAKKTLKEEGEMFFKDYNAELDSRLFAALFKIFSDNVEPEFYPEIIKEINGKYKGDYARFAKELKEKSIFVDEARYNAFIEKPDCKKLEKDMAYRAGESVNAFFRQYAKNTSESRKRLTPAKRLFVGGLMEMNPNRKWAPDANSTLRLTYGRVGSYRPKDAVFYDYYTTLTGVFEKEGPAGGEFEVPQRLKELNAKKDFAPYGTNNIVTCFITDNDITGGNSGSSVINANGELIGIAFDGNSEAMSGDIDFEENLQRCINVDIRYVLFIIDKYAGAENLIREMTIVK